MPSHTPKQKKVMSAIAHGWKPKGSAAGIPVKVAKEFHAADRGKYGHKPKGYDRSSHHPGNPGFNREGKAPYGEYRGGAHAIQPKGKSLGAAPEMERHRPGQSFAEEQREHMGIPRKGQGMGHKGKMGNIDHPKGSHLLDEGGVDHDRQPHGRSIGYKGSCKAEHHRNTTFGGAAHSYGHAAHQRSGDLRLSGHSGGHRIGKR